MASFSRHEKNVIVWFPKRSSISAYSEPLKMQIILMVIITKHLLEYYLYK